MKAKSRQQIAEEYGIHPITLRRWLKEAGIKLPRGLVRPRDQARIYQHFGIPAARPATGAQVSGARSFG